MWYKYAGIPLQSSHDWRDALQEDLPFWQQDAASVPVSLHNIFEQWYHACRFNKMLSWFPEEIPQCNGRPKFKKNLVFRDDHFYSVYADMIQVQFGRANNYCSTRSTWKRIIRDALNKEQIECSKGKNKWWFYDCTCHEWLKLEIRRSGSFQFQLVSFYVSSMHWVDLLNHS